MDKDPTLSEMDNWDRQMPTDIEAGKFDAITKPVLEDNEAGLCTDLFEGLEKAHLAREST